MPAPGVRVNLALTVISIHAFLISKYFLMKLNVVYTLFSLLLIAAGSLSSSSGAGAVQGVDRTGSPVGNGSCASCHNSGTFDPSISLSVLDDGMAVSEYQPGKTYQFEVKITAASGSPNAYGFQAVALSGADNDGAGSFGAPPQGIQLTSINGREYAEQSQRASEGTFVLDWTAPDSDVGEIRFYAGGNAADGAGGTAGDNGVFLDSPLTLGFSTVSSSANVSSIIADYRIFGNPVQNKLRLRLEGGTAGEYQLDLLDYTGKLLQTQTVMFKGAQLTTEMPMNDLAPGFYLLHISNGLQHHTEKIIKQ